RTQSLATRDVAFEQRHDLSPRIHQSVSPWSPDCHMGKEQYLRVRTRAKRSASTSHGSWSFFCSPVDYHVQSRSASCHVGSLRLSRAARFFHLLRPPPARSRWAARWTRESGSRNSRPAASTLSPTPASQASIISSC